VKHVGHVGTPEQPGTTLATLRGDDAGEGHRRGESHQDAAARTSESRGWQRSGNGGQRRGSRPFEIFES
jgi:hypothetical protein